MKDKIYDISTPKILPFKSLSETQRFREELLSSACQRVPCQSKTSHSDGPVVPLFGNGNDLV